MMVWKMIFRFRLGCILRFQPLIFRGVCETSSIVEPPKSPPKSQQKMSTPHLNCIFCETTVLHSKSKLEKSLWIPGFHHETWQKKITSKSTRNVTESYFFPSHFFFVFWVFCNIQCQGTQESLLVAWKNHSSRRVHATSWCNNPQVTKEKPPLQVTQNVIFFLKKTAATIKGISRCPPKWYPFPIRLP